MQELAKFFPAYQQKVGQSFDPTAECVALERQKKKKSAIKQQRKVKQASVTVIMMEKFSPSIPKGNARKRLSSCGRMKSIRLSRDMSAEEVKGKILQVFNCTDFTLLECDSSQTLCKCDDQNIDGERAVERKGALYLCENTPTKVIHAHTYVLHVLYLR